MTGLYIYIYIYILPFSPEKKEAKKEREKDSFSLRSQEFFRTAPIGKNKRGC